MLVYFSVLWKRMSSSLGQYGYLILILNPPDFLKQAFSEVVSHSDEDPF